MLTREAENFLAMMNILELEGSGGGFFSAIVQVFSHGLKPWTSALSSELTLV